MVSARNPDWSDNDPAITYIVTYEAGDGEVRRFNYLGKELGNGRECDSVELFLSLVRSWGWVCPDDDAGALWDVGL